MKKILIFLFILLNVISTAHSTISISDNNDRGYYNLTNLGTEATGRTGDLVNTSGAPTSVTGIIGGAYEFSGTSGSQFKNTSNVVVTAYPFTINAWVNYTQVGSGTTDNAGVLTIGAGSGFNPYYGLFIDGGLAKANARPAGGAESFAISTTNITGMGWVMLTAVYNSNTDKRIYVNCVNEANDTTSALFSAGVDTVTIGGNSDANTDQFLVGGVDEGSIWNKSLTSAEICQLYNGGAGLTWNFIPTGTTPQINTNLTDDGYYNHRNISVKSNATSAVNMSVSINGGAFVDLATAVTVSTNTINFTEGQNNVSFKSIDSNGQAHNNITIYIDTTNPTITDSINTPIYNYTFVASQFSCNDTYIDSCNISIDSFNKNNTQTFTLTHNGNLSYTITAIDLAGNTATSTGYLYVNPYQYFYFYDVDSAAYVSSYTFGSYSSVGTKTTIPLYDLGIGTHSLLFDKASYPLTNFSFTFTNTSTLNTTFNINITTIKVYAYDRTSFNRITQAVTLQIIGNITSNGTTTTGNYNFTNINRPSGTYYLLANSNGYETELLSFTYNDQEEITLNVYLLNSTIASYVTNKVKDNLGNFIEAATVYLLEWDSSTNSYISISQCTTNSGGQCNLNVELNTKLYKFKATKGSLSTTTSAQVINTAGTIIPLTLVSSPLTFSPQLSSLSYKFNESISGNVTTSRFEWYDSDNLVTQACIKTYRITTWSDVLLSENCTSASTGILFKNDLINNTYDIAIKAYVFYDTQAYLIGVLRHKSIGDISESLQDYGMDILIPVIFIFLAVATGLFFGNIYISLSLIVILEWIAVFIVPSVISSSIAVVITIIAGLTIWGSYRR